MSRETILFYLNSDSATEMLSSIPRIFELELDPFRGDFARDEGDFSAFAFKPLLFKLGDLVLSLCEF